MLFYEEVNIILGNKKIINDSEVAIVKDTKYGVLGPNGVGKTTLINHIYNKIKDKIDVLYITQTEHIDDNCTIFEYMLKSDKKLYDKFRRLEELEEIQSQEELEDSLFDEYKNLSEELQTLNFKKYESEIMKILHGLGFYDKNKCVNLLSGGQHTKLSLCKGLLISPDLLLLDEPTNHLDLKNILWLENYLTKYKKGLIVISHNINFIDSICDRIIYFFNMDPQCPKVYACKGGYNNFSQAFNQKKDDYKKKYDIQCKKLAELKKKNDKTELDRFLQKPQINKPLRDYDINIYFNEVRSLGANDYTNIVSFNDVSFSYGEKKVLDKINLGISMSSRYILVGDNGSGKSTFFNLCSRKLDPESGEIIFDTRIRIGYFNQHSITELPEDITAIEYLQSINNSDNSLDQQSCRKILAEIGFKKMFEGDTFDIGSLKISDLSGGQKVKIVLCGIKINNPHVILFDEPTNHLDIYSIDEFIKAINEYNGGVVIITHDRYIIENINNYELLILEDKQIQKYNGNFDEYCEEILELGE
jgi:ATP-binding cassette subfamily F protein 1